jgi:DNA processing protein
MISKLDDRDYYLALSMFSGIGPKRLQLIKDHFGTLSAFFQADKETMLAAGLNYGVVVRFIAFREKLDLGSYKLRLQKSLIKWITAEDKDYPKLLLEIPNPPLVLFVKGNILPEDEKALAVIGTRKPTAYGQEVTQKLVADLVAYGFTIISGLARGVDSLAHRVTLGQGGRTIAVLGSGLDWIYPPENRSLANEISKNGALISEYPPDTRPTPGQFPARNRIISGLSLGILITEGASKSGTKSTAACAADQGREVFCVPGPITNPLSLGPAELIKLGAKLTTSIDDILDELHFKDILPKKQTDEKMAFTDPREEQLYRSLSSGSKTADQLALELDCRPADIFSRLTALELKGLIKSVGDGQYMVC